MSDTQASATEAPAPPEDLAAIRASVNDAASVSGGLWISYLFVMFYLAVAAAAVTHGDLFLQKPVKLPFLGLDLPLLAFFAIAPLLLLAAHAYTLMHFVMLAEKTIHYHEALRRSFPGADEARRRAITDDLRRQLPANIFVQLLAGPPETGSGAFGRALGSIARVSLAIAPVFVFLLLEVQFLPYQHAAVTWWHRLALGLDLAILWWLWPRVLRGRDALAVRARGPALIGRAAFSALALIFAVFVATSEDEALARLLPLKLPLPDIGEIGATRLPDADECIAAKRTAERPLRWRVYALHDYLFRSPIDCIGRRRLFPFSSTLVLTGLDAPEALGLDPALKGREFAYRARGRRLKGAVFDFANLPKIDFEGANLEGASFLESKLGDSSFHLARISQAQFVRARAAGASFDGAVLEGASFQGADLRGADFSQTRLTDVDLSSTSLVGANFESACLLRPRFRGADLFGVEFAKAGMLDADFAKAALVASSFAGAAVEGGSFRGATVETSDFTDAALEDARGPAAVLARPRYRAPTGQAEALRGCPGIARQTAPETPPAPPLTDFRADLAAAAKDQPPLSGDAAPKLIQRLCADSLGALYFLRGPAFARLDGPDLPLLLAYALSPDSPVASKLTDDDRTRLASRRAAVLKAAPASDAKPPHC